MTGGLWHSVLQGAGNPGSFSGVRQGSVPVLSILRSRAKAEDGRNITAEA